MCFLKSKYSWLTAPVIWLAACTVLTAMWACCTPETIRLSFDQDGHSPVEMTTVGLFFFQMAFLWLVPPMRPGRRRTFFLVDFSLLTFFAICRELDWHKLLITPSTAPGTTHGTPFKMKYLLNAHNPLADRIIVALCFVVVLGLCGGTLAYFLPRLWKGLFAFHPVSWTIGFLGGTTILIQIVDRMPAVLRHSFGIQISDAQHALTTALEEGQELLLPIFVMIAVLQAHFIYNNDPEDGAALRRFSDS